MANPINLNPRIIEALYAEGLMLSDEVRAAVDPGQRREDVNSDAARVALSCEALRTTTRMMHAMAWLINHRAYFRNEISEFHIRRHGRLADNLPVAAPARLALLPADVQTLIRATEHFYARLVRLDASWRQGWPQDDRLPAVARLRERLSKAVG